MIDDGREDDPGSCSVLPGDLPSGRKLGMESKQVDGDFPENFYVTTK